MNPADLRIDWIKRPFVWPLVVFVLYFLAAKLGLKYAVIGQTVTLMWPPSGIALAAILLGGFRVLPGIALGAFVANLWSEHLGTFAAFIISIGDILEPLCGAALLKAESNFSLALDKTGDVLKLLVLAACGSTTIGATFGVLGLFANGDTVSDTLTNTWLTWWLGDGMGVLVISPVILTGASTTHAVSLKAFSLRAVEILSLLIAAVLIGYTIFNRSELAGIGYFETSLSMFPFAIWSALRFGAFGASSVALIVSALAIHGTVNGTGPFALESKLNSLILWCLFADLMAITGLILGAVNCERKKAVTELTIANETLDRQVKERTHDLLKTNLELHATLAERNRLQFEMNQISEERQKMFGQELHDGLGQQIIGIAFLVSSISETLKAKAMPEAIVTEKIKQLIDEAMMGVRALSRGLYPTALEMGGLASALEHLAEYSQNASDVIFKFQCDTQDMDIDKSIALNLYRIAQEAVCNALRHSEAQRIDIKLCEARGRYCLTINDDGVGLPERIGRFAGSLGLRSMESRANLIGATIEFRNNATRGTSIIVSGPNKQIGEYRNDGK